MERVTAAPDVLRIVRGTPDAHETAAVVALLVARLGGPSTEPPAVRPERPVWQPFTGHRTGGWGRP
ncbi:acyl-CoA carboxylase epsilon subunit [Streptomyces sp. PSKA30]|uniref:acyl-CoA carboxylase epsilon subunit n=1 Tax=Streptomyces sp. PSKA30 TaxID=2874597 RepID=UPI001CD11A85|nr:acyl-CoA carboxylase epsilon subunit [Streptomyces sp. PSKA30]MBZ9641600.1 hypothetical protein [Streptomyces sp. PSKA30]